MSDRASHSDLEVFAPQSGLERYVARPKYDSTKDKGKQGLLAPTPPEQAPESTSTRYLWEGDGSNNYRGGGEPAKSTNEKAILGMRRKSFWRLILILGTVIIAAGVGGALGGVLANRKNVNKASQQPDPTQSSGAATSSPAITNGGNSGAAKTTTPTPTTATPSPISISLVVGPSSTLISDCPSSNQSVYSVQVSHTTFAFRKFCGLSFPNTLSATEALVNQITDSLDSCIELCAAWNIAQATVSNSSSICQAVCWRNRFIDDDFPGQCFWLPNEEYNG